MNKVNIIGSYFRDYIHVLKKNKYTHWESDGGICNLMDNQVTIWSTDYNESVELINNLGRDGRVIKWGEISLDLTKLCNARGIADWNHFCYVNTIQNLDISKFKSKISSVDISTSWRDGIHISTALKNCELADFVFMSSEVCDGNFGEDFLKASKIAIVHDAEGSWAIKYGELLGRYRHKKEDFVYTLGAGDRFARHFIEASLKSNGDWNSILEYANKNTLNWLREINEKL